MPKANVNKNENDPRAARTVAAIKQTMLDLISREPFDQIRVEQILSEAPVTSNTFYRYFSSKQDVVDTIGADILSDALKKLTELPEKSLGGGYVRSTICSRHRILHIRGFFQMRRTCRFLQR